MSGLPDAVNSVSTHSRPKAAGITLIKTDVVDFPGFNTQPPEGGWPLWQVAHILPLVSTHSRPKAAGRPFFILRAC